MCDWAFTYIQNVIRVAAAIRNLSDIPCVISLFISKQLRTVWFFRSWIKCLCDFIFFFRNKNIKKQTCVEKYQGRGEMKDGYPISSEPWSSITTIPLGRQITPISALDQNHDKATKTPQKRKKISGPWKYGAFDHSPEPSRLLKARISRLNTDYFGILKKRLKFFEHFKNHQKREIQVVQLLNMQLQK